MAENIVRKTPAGNYMVLNFARHIKHGLMQIPLVTCKKAALHFTQNQLAKHKNFCMITKEFYFKL